jgi:hypothetical protein
MTPRFIMPCVIDPAMAVLGVQFDTTSAVKMLLAIAWQESRFKHRKQIGGPARSYFQFEPIGVQGVLEHQSSKVLAIGVCAALDHLATKEWVYDAIKYDAVLACCFARLLLWTDPKPLPETEEDGWKYYLGLWRPGKPHPETWFQAWQFAHMVMGGA